MKEDKERKEKMEEKQKMERKELLDAKGEDDLNFFNVSFYVQYYLTRVVLGGQSIVT